MEQIAKQKYSSSLRLFLLLTLFILVQFGTAQSTAKQSTTTLKVTSRPRPLAVAVDQLAHSRGWLISYEDQPYTFAGDIEDLTAYVGQYKGHPVRQNSKQVIGPRRGSINLTYSNSASPSQILQQVVRSHEASNDAAFQVKEVRNRYVVMPARTKDEHGQKVAQIPLLSTPINLNAMDRDGEETFREICKAITSATGTKVSPGVGPLLGRFHTKLSAIDEPARDVLARFLDGIGLSREVWVLYNDPTTHMYTLNLDHVAKKDEGAAIEARK